MSSFKKAFCIIIAALLLSAVSVNEGITLFSISYADKEDGSKIIVSLGDSYASGEGVEPFYGQDDPYKQYNSLDWMAHRSEKSWSGQLTLPSVNGPMSKHKDENWFFVAASGATTEHMKGKQLKTATVYQLPIQYEVSQILPPQLSVFNNLGEGNTADYVTITIGGNDAHFSEIITLAATSSYYLNRNKLKQRIDQIWKEFYEEGGIRDKIKQAYHDICDAAGPQATVIVAGYPTLLDRTGKGAMFSIQEAEIINTAVEQFNVELEKIVIECKNEGLKICFVPIDFTGHEAYSKNSYLNPVWIGSRTQDLNAKIASHYSMHPNEKGIEQYRKAVQKKIDELEDIYSNNYTSHTGVPDADCIQDIIDQTEEGWSIAYRRFIYGQEYLNNPSVHYGSDSNCVNFGLHDFDGNGLPELVIGNGVDAHMGAGCYVYTYHDDGIHYLGEILSWAGSNESGEGLFYYDDAIYTGVFWEEEFQRSLCRNYYYLDDLGELKTELVETGSYDEEWSRDSYKVEQRTSDDTLFILGRDPARISFVMFSYSDIFENGWDLFVRFYESIETELMSHQDEQENEETLSGWKKIYQDFIQNETYEQFRQYGDELWFALHDLDGDGTPELIYTDGGEWYEYDYIVCTIRSGGVVCIGKMCAPLGAWFDEGFPFLYSEDDRYPGLFSKNNIYGYYGNESDRYCGYFEIGSGGTIAEQVVEASIGDRTLKETDEDLLFRLGIYGDLHPLRFYEVSTLMDDGWGTFWSYWYQPEDHVEFDIWHAVEKSNVLDYISMTYDEVCGLSGQLEMINVEMDSPRHYLFRFAGLSDMELSFETDLSEAEEYMDEYGRIPASVASQYIDGTERCDGILVYSVNAFRGSDFNAADISAEIFEFMPDTGLWMAHTEHAGCDFYFVCEDSDGSISDRCAVWIVGNPSTQEEQVY